MNADDPRAAQSNNATGGGVQIITQAGDIVMESREESRPRAKHSRFIGFGLAAVLVVAAVAGWIAAERDQDAQMADMVREGLALMPNLEAAKVSAYIAGGSSGEVLDGDSPPEKVTDVRSPHVDLKLGNVVHGASLITKASITFTRFQSLEPCSAEGGRRVFTADYQFAVPDGQLEVPLARPFTLSKEFTHEVVADKYDRFELTVGSRSRPEGAAPWVAVMEVVLEHDGGKQLKIGPIAVVDTGSISTFHPDGDQWVFPASPAPGCIEKNLELVSDVLRIPNLVVSKELSSLNRTLQQFRK
ncbi:hypothetical protein [Kitasatospora sp. CB02891]|uniref:hypothetical protein n=1 Tax=Kitasatospora sp. CB02891 TaxID=2020329 RepID=UPI000C27962B|nr:hypothetical protein [Kitasatospora sp. CB02891]PJN26005.1 hypothetical protein CG736_11430 [Kitasatospora sp. CB02891]